MAVAMAANPAKNYDYLNFLSFSMGKLRASWIFYWKWEKAKISLIYKTLMAWATGIDLCVHVPDGQRRIYYFNSISPHDAL